MSHVFISYSKEQKDYARRLADYLRGNGFEVWLDDDRIRPADDWQDVMYEAVRTCAACIVVMTPEARKSKWVKKEVAWAEDLDKKFFPLLLDGENWHIFPRTQYADVRDGGLPQDDFLEALSEYVPRQVQQPEYQKSVGLPIAFVGPEKKRSSLVPHILPPPFEWVNIPAGNVVLELPAEPGIMPPGPRYESFNVPAFAIAKYPVTNAQYEQFIMASGYRQKKWWTQAGLEIRKQEGWTEPLYWQDEIWNSADYPVVGVSWYEAVAFCRWLSEASGEVIQLPTEQQWQRAAQGDDGRQFPWGDDEPNQWFCNWDNNIGNTTPVTQYPAGASSYGVMDMSGNVWEWCLTVYETGSTSLDEAGARSLRGGPWDRDSRHICCTYRTGRDPEGRYYSRGFRIVRTTPE